MTDRSLLACVLAHPLDAAVCVLDIRGNPTLRNAAATRLLDAQCMRALAAPLADARAQLAMQPDPGGIELAIRDSDGALHGEIRVAHGTDGSLEGYTLCLWRSADGDSGSAELERWRFALESAQDGVWDWTADSGRVYRSPRCLAMVGYDEESMPDTVEAWHALVHPDDAALQADAIAAHARGETDSYQVEYRVRHADGRWIWILDRGRVVVRDPDGRARRSFGTHTDITLYKTLEVQLRLRERLLNEAQRHAQLGSWTWSVDSGQVSWSNELYRIAGWPEGTAPPSFAQQRPLFTADSYAQIEAALSRSVRDGTPFSLALELIRADGRGRRHTLTRGEVVRDESGRIVRLAGVVQDITEIRVEQEARRRERQLLDRVSALGNIGGFELLPSSGVVFLTDQSYRILKLAPGTTLDASAIIALYAPESQPLLRDAVQHAIGTGGPFDLELELVRSDGERIWMRTRGEAEMFAGRCVRLFGTLQDVTERREAERQIAQLAHYDTLTGLPNRVLFADRARVAIARARRTSSPLALLFIDLDNFKMVNDSLGHAAGDRLLQEVTRRFQACIRASDTVSRQGGDEFLVLLPEIRKPEDAAVIAQKLIDALDAPIALPGMDAAVGCSVGIALLGPMCADLDALLRNADAAMYDAKAAGRRRYRFFSEDLQQRAHGRLTLENELREALAQQRFHLCYQPQIDIESGRVVGLEALLRLHVDGGLDRSAGEFIATAEDSGLIVPLGEWVLESACFQLSQWRAQGFDDLRVALNISALQMRQGDFSERLRQACERHGLPTQAIEVELRESVLMDDPGFAQPMLERLAAAGVSVAVDDFGTGFSNLAHLRRFPLSRLKIDRAFVATLDSEPGNAKVADAIVSLGHTLGMRVIAEGVESAMVLARLRALGCDEAQGHFVSLPLAPEEIPAWLESRR